TELPSGASIVKEGCCIAENIEIGRTAFMDKMGIDSELEYKRHCIKNRQIMYHAHIGMNTWQDTVEAMALLYRTAEESGFVVDRAGICLDRRMALPKNKRDQIPAETGPELNTQSQWQQVGQAVPIQPHMGDFMIGFPASVENTVQALKAGVTTIGNLSQFFAHEVPMWTDKVSTTIETVKAISVMGAMKNRGTLVHSYLEDGFPALFKDCATVAGWAFLERYIVEKLLNAKLSHCIGGLTSDPLKRAAWVFTLNKIHDHDCIGSMIYGDTISFGIDFNRNRGLVAEYLLWDIMSQLECPTGNAVLPLPVTEALRIPSAEEIAEAHCFGRRIEQTARRLMPYIDFTPAYDFSAKLYSAGKSVFENAVAGFKEAKIDIDDPVQMLYVMKMLGASDFEEMFGVGKVNEDSSKGRQPVYPTDVFEMSQRVIDENEHFFDNPRSRSRLEGRKFLIASTDVHAHAVTIIHELLSRAGSEITNLGAEINPDQIARAAKSCGVEAILISTHNGMALEYSNRLKAELDRQKVDVPVI
ncbi:MAG: cobalamin B12-binding domain-containing protein, partial [bacterium]|nr:cobalamin B12-binding domain-containing protein [bacterium]